MENSSVPGGGAAFQTQDKQDRAQFCECLRASLYPPVPPPRAGCLRSCCLEP